MSMMMMITSTCSSTAAHLGYCSSSSLSRVSCMMQPAHNININSPVAGPRMLQIISTVNKSRINNASSFVELNLKPAVISFNASCMSRKSSTTAAAGPAMKYHPAGPQLRVSCSSSSSSSSDQITSNSSTLERVQEIIAMQLSVELASVQPHTKFSDLGADSLDTVEIVMAMEEEFGVSISEENAEEISTVQQVADLIEQQQQKVVV